LLALPALSLVPSEIGWCRERNGRLPVSEDEFQPLSGRSTGLSLYKSPVNDRTTRRACVRHCFLYSARGSGAARVDSNFRRFGRRVFCLARVALVVGRFFRHRHRAEISRVVPFMTPERSGCSVRLIGAQKLFQHFRVVVQEISRYGEMLSL